MKASTAPTTREQLLARLFEIECHLEPERLSWDGERPRSVWKREEQRLRRERQAVVRLLGGEPAFSELEAAAEADRARRRQEWAALRENLAAA